MKLEFANEIDKKGGWTLSPSYLKKVQGKIGDNEDTPSLEQIEMTLLAVGIETLSKEAEDFAKLKSVYTDKDSIVVDYLRKSAEIFDGKEAPKRMDRTT